MEAPDLVFHNANVLTLDPARPRVRAIAVTRGLVTATGTATDVRRLAGRGTRVVECAGATITPGFNDAHMHLLALASRMVGVDCSPGRVRSVDDLKREVRARAMDTPRGSWVRGWGYDESSLAEARHPTRADLDEAAPDHPVRLKHRSGHATVLSSLALEMVGIGERTPDPPSGVMERDEHGVPTGLLLEMDDYLEGRVAPLARDDLERGLRVADGWLRAHGVTTVQDATPTNDHARWRLLQGLADLVTPRLVLMPGIDRLGGFVERGMAQGHREGRIVLGPAKVMATLTTGTMTPAEDHLAALARRARGHGFALAVHAVEAEVVEAAARALREERWAGGTPPHRIEHASEVPPGALGLIAESGAMVVTNSGFLYFGGDRYRAEVSPDSHPWLYRIGSLERIGVRTAFGSDAPVELPDPAAQLYGAVSRRSMSGRALGEGEAVSGLVALHAHTLGGADAAGLDGWLGRLAPGMAADLVLLDRDPTTVPPDELRGLRVLMTVVAGRVVWEA